ncbi:probable ubiquitin-conjugating enzyme E2 25 isoform X2 [Solanum dulcamara]|uniref:probable ubiquitin-conjugating enzyme E2 25 isoform X2 n=1 Tax=Solanum dulcamara TaxID=45834 RepID=UPI002486BFBA|nr:probable ubiquitin-conjugating enzyme E2 25 isoform X2 [Solanum dulcamara]
MILLMHRKRRFPGGGSIDAEVVEISRPINWSSKSKSLKQKEVIFQEIIDVDVEEDFSDVKRSSGNVKFSGKGKDILVGNGSSGNGGPVDGVQSEKKSYLSSSNNPIIIDEFGSDVHFGADEYMNMFFDDLLYDDYAVLQSRFDNMDIPTGVEAPIPWMPGPIKEQMVSTTTTTSGRDVSGTMRDQSTSFSSSTPVGQPTQFGSSWSSPGSALGKEGQFIIGSSSEKSSKGVSSSKILSSGVEKQLSSHCEKNRSSGATASFGNNPSKLYKESLAHYGKKLGSSGATTSSGWGNQSTHSGPHFPKFPFGSPVSDLSNVFLKRNTVISAGIAQASAPMMNSFPQNAHKSATTAGCPSIPSGPACNGEQHRNLGETLTKFRLFKKFDTVEDHSDHFYSRQASSGNVPSKNWAKKIQEEWKILENDLPDTIFVRVYESRMDLLRAVIMGADGTPYHDGLYFFDVFFPSNYPNVPPLVHYHSFGLRINPNLYNCGKVCLSLLNTWTGQGKEKWIPRASTMLQVLVSIQGLILNAKPYFNEPGYASSGGTARGDESSLRYNENTYILNLKTMVYSMRRPPKHFEDFVLGHFFQSAQEILVACKAYIDGAQVGSLVRGGVQDVDEGDKSCSPTFKASLAGFIKTVIDTFKEIGAKDCDKFLHLAQIGTGVALIVPANAASYFFGKPV